MNIDVYVRTGYSIQVTPQVPPSYAISNIPVYVSSGQQGASKEWVDSGYYPRSNPSGYATGIDGSLYVRKTESGQFVGTSQTGQFYSSNNPSGYLTTGQLVKFETVLTSGAELQTISFPLTLSIMPITIIAEFVNDSDNLIYGHTISSVTTSGYVVNFSDVLSSTGYKLYSTITL